MAENVLGGLAQLLQTIGGTRQTTTSNPGDITALQQVFQQGQNFDPNALLQAIFQQAGGQIPGLQRALGNAIGARSGNNSAVSAALQKLLMQTSLAGQQQVSTQILQNQQQQGNVAANIANATKGTTQTQKSGTDMANIAKLLGLWQLAGQTGLIDKIGKGLGVGGAATGGTSTGTASAPAPTTTSQAPATVQSAAAPAPVAMQSAQSFPVSGGVLDVGIPLGSTIDTGLLDQPGMGSMEWTNGATLTDGFSTYSDMFADQANNLASMEGIDSMDALMGVTDGFGTIEGGGSNFIDDILGLLGFADGGLVGRDGAHEIPSYADGGIVRGPRRNTTPQANPLTATANNTATGGTRAVAPTTQRPGTPATPGVINRPQRPREDLDFGIGAEGSAVGTPGAPSGLSAGESNALGMALGLLGAGHVGSLAAAGTAPGATNNSVLGTLGVVGLNAVAPGLGTVAGLIGGLIGMATATGNEVGNTGGMGLGSAMGGENVDMGNAAGNAGDNSVELGLDLGLDSGVGGAGAAGTGATGGAAGDAGSDGSAAAGVGVGASGAGEASDGLGFASGGKVTGPGTGTSDSIIARVSNGEYVVSADVVETIGVDFFDALQAALHKPATMYS